MTTVISAVSSFDGGGGEGEKTSETQDQAALAASAMVKGEEVDPEGGAALEAMSPTTR